jgi:hypothetical protein
VGLLALVFGVLLLVQRLGTPARLVELAAHWWPLLIIGAVLANLATFVGPPMGRAEAPWPLIGLGAAFAVAVVALLFTTGRVPRSVLGYATPLLLVIVGAGCALSGGRPDREYRDTIVLNAFLRRVCLRGRSRQIDHVTVRAVFGEIVLDLTDASTAGDAAVHATVFWGRVELRCPASWPVYTQPPVGDVRVESVPPPDDPSKTRLWLSAMGSHGVVRLRYCEPVRST